ncbi:MAG: 50S ribosomal protein L32 [Candidatus Lloydbacteria bacterium CG22_combo_CG10-13_8_21_14_all_47_15]|uniref:Large ribosomal subunit protein bL32 n=1 Tax=Candidatus Lloydbacteria bacterium CG22_combo_CG10-13_8_21_14_all_47_15 TaxID=1974635 RepID=A0A2H0CTE5_9BACT|nr:MAG: 50S ribosomal protein L32 [Candidatus Lloydbacteria bacterium CG22_combo_CG10-13_8_21_14_all_47_15]
MTVRMRTTRSKTAHRRSHHALVLPRLSKCEECSADKLRHRMCSECGSYRGRAVLDVKGKRAERQKRRVEKLKTLGEEPDKAREKAAKEASQSLDAVDLSNKK